ncbi:MAG: flagellar biosynthesis anti-sigma factor FlgM [Desulfobacterales bacterium]|jgi:negative regulator of flagellin synthesis FlgM|nr:flagellar biosynthesis anti-sigma factor FlgM [Desulfobacterales bacterium]MDH3829517.1 flagellar biosynthesis anti-sigma factor FlgM [Desulfobacterales bacterium]MDH3877342.1 flagellar biosynthesis anti-sigma factor FlgM [Desulfobacterales bacterium]
MEITPKDTVNIEAYVNQVQNKDKVDATSEQPEKQQTKADTVVLSDTAKKVQEAQKQLETIPDVREDKVAQLKEQIENKTYDMDEEKIAGKMIKDALLNDLL